MDRTNGPQEPNTQMDVDTDTNTQVQPQPVLSGNFRLYPSLSAELHGVLTDHCDVPTMNALTRTTEFLRNAVQNTMDSLKLPYALGTPEEYARRFRYDANGEAVEVIHEYFPTRRQPMCRKIELGDTNSVRVFLDAGVNANAYDFYGRRLLRLAALYEHPDIVSLLLQRGANPSLHDIGEERETALRTAARLRNDTIVCILIRAGADMRHADTFHEIIANCQLDTVRLAVLHGADLLWTDPAGNTTLHAAALNDRNLAVTRWILSQIPELAARLNEAGETVLWPAIASYNLRAIRSLYRHVNVSTRSDNGETALHMAARHGILGIIPFLLRDGVNVNGCSDDGFTPLHESIAANNYQITNYLIFHGANIDYSPTEAGTPLHHAAARGHWDMILLLRRRGANPKVTDGHGRTADEVAFDYGWTEVGLEIEQWILSLDGSYW